KHTHTHTHIFTYSQTHTHTLFHKHTYSHIFTHTHTHIYTHTHTHTHSHTHTHTYSYTHIHTHTNTRTQTHIHTFIHLIISHLTNIVPHNVLALALTDVISFIIQVSKERLPLSSPVWVGMPFFPAGMWFIQTALLLHGLWLSLDKL